MTDYPSGPIGAAQRAADARDQRPASGRHTADTITGDELDQLYAELRDARGEADRYFHNGLKSTGQADMRAYDAEQRAKQTEAALVRVRAELDRMAALPTVDRDEIRADTFSTGARWALDQIRAALTEPKEPRP
ncbi:hypothetical protein [Streptomyces racemochromogenes]|uniref:hypothetical protein n=1 Tax=Streptomyces racemochromogenes TaxID=67353 RepID=UPI0031ECF96A